MALRPKTSWIDSDASRSCRNAKRRAAIRQIDTYASNQSTQVHPPLKLLSEG